MMVRRMLLVSTVATSVWGSPQMASAQVAEPDRAVPTAGEPDPGDIIVTARRRQESLLRTPVVEAVLTQKQLLQYQVTDIGKVVARVPGLGVGQQPASIGTQVSLRGVGTTTLDAGVDQSVSLNIDGMQFTQGLAYKLGFFDLAQAEVLKGPQALFFGKNSPAGVIALRTADPGSDAEFIGRTGYEFAGQEWRSELIASGPVTSTLGIRLAGSYTDYNGFYRNRAQATPGFGGITPHDDRLGGTREYLARGTVVWKPDPAFDARLKLNYSHSRGNGPALQYLSCPEGSGSVNTPPVPFMAGENCRRDRTLRIVDLDPASYLSLRYGGRQTYIEEQYFGTLELNYRPADGLALTSVTGYYDVSSKSLFNGTVTTDATSLAPYNDLRRHDFTQELRLNSDFESPLNFTAGAFYQDARARNFGDVQTNRTVSALLRVPLPPRLIFSDVGFDIKTYSGFGQLRWKVASNLELAGGVRYTDEKRDATGVNFITGTARPVTYLNPELRSKNWSPEATLTYTPTDTLTLYGSFKQAYKSGSFPLSRGPVPAPALNSFGDEKVQGGEVGLKTKVLDRALFLNVAGYYYYYNGLQVGTNSNDPNICNTGLCNVTLNAGAARVYGVDVDANYQPRSVPGLALRSALNWNHARFVRLENVSCSGGQTAAQGCNVPLRSPTGAVSFVQDLSGIPLVRAPNWQITGGFDYDIAVAAMSRVTFGGELLYSSKYLTQITDRRDSDQPGYAKVNAHVTYVAPGGRWELSLLGNNLTNKLTTGTCTVFAGQIGALYRSPNQGRDEVQCAMDRGRELWARATIRL